MLCYIIRMQRERTKAENLSTISLNCTVHSEWGSSNLAIRRQIVDCENNQNKTLNENDYRAMTDYYSWGRKNSAYYYFNKSVFFFPVRSYLFYCCCVVFFFFHSNARWSWERNKCGKLLLPFVLCNFDHYYSLHTF